VHSNLNQYATAERKEKARKSLLEAFSPSRSLHPPTTKMVSTRGSIIRERINQEVADRPLGASMDMMQEALDCVRKLNKSDESASKEDLLALSEWAVQIKRFKNIPGIEKHFLLQYVIAEELLKMIDDCVESQI